MKQLKDYIVTENNFFKNLGIGQVALIRKWIEDNCDIKGSYTINDDLTIDIKGDVDLHRYGEKELPEYIQFGCVDGCFEINECPNLTSLKGCPKEVGGSFDCSGCKNLTFLKDSPQKVGGSFDCIGCLKLESLEGCPKEVGERFSCNGCPKLDSLKGSPKKVGYSFTCSYCSSLNSLKDCPKEVGGHFYCDHCGKQFTKDDVKKYCNVKQLIHV